MDAHTSVDDSNSTCGAANCFRQLTVYGCFRDESYQAAVIAVTARQSKCVEITMSGRPASLRDHTVIQEKALGLSGQDGPDCG